MDLLKQIDHLGHVGTRLGLLVPAQTDQLLEFRLHIFRNLKKEMVRAWWTPC